MAIQYTKNGRPINLQAEVAVAAVASTTAVLEPSQLYSGSGGTFTVIPVGQTDSVTFVGVPAGTVLPVLITTLETTTATNVVRLS